MRFNQYGVVVFAVFMMAGAANVAAEGILIEFSSEHCPPCRAMQPIVSELIARGVPVRQVDVQAEPQLTQRFKIRSTPTYVVLQDGKEVSRLLGTQSIQKLRNALGQNASGPIVPTRSQFAAPTRNPASAVSQPQTRLAPMPGNFGPSAGGSSQSFRQQRTESAIEPMPSMTLADAVERAQAATVRLRVYDGRGYGAGTGTIIDVHGEEALVLTCGHLFRDGKANDKIEVDIFVGGQPTTVEGHLVDFDAGDRDIGLVAIRPGIAIQAVEVIRDNETVRVGQAAFSFGCDRGDDPSRRDTRITGVNKYNQNIGASNLEISGAPIDGRSGGGLFDERGRLIGVCNAADYKSDIGIYTGPGSIEWQLDRVKLSHLYEARPGDTPSRIASNAVDNVMPASFNAPINSHPVNLNPAAGLAAGGNDWASQSNTDMEMIVILRDGNGKAQEQILTLNQPDAELVQRIRQAARR